MLLTLNADFVMSIVRPVIIYSQDVLHSPQTSTKLRMIVWGNICTGRSQIDMTPKELTTGMSIIQI